MQTVTKIKKESLYDDLKYAKTSVYHCFIMVVIWICLPSTADYH